MMVRIWDLRALTSGDIQDLKQTLNGIRDRQTLVDEGLLHPKLDWANVHLRYDDISYAIEWHDRIWPNDKVTDEDITDSLLI
jgi:hypothetical protein